MPFLLFFFNSFLHIFIIFIFSYNLGLLSLFFMAHFSFSNFFFYFFPFLIGILLFFSFSTNNPINALLYILSTFILIGLLLLQHSIEFLSYIFLIVYIGAVMMLFLFIVMLFNLQQNTKKNKKNLSQFVQFFIFLIFIMIILSFFDSNFYALSLKNQIFINSNTLYSIIFFFNTITLDGIRALETLYMDNNILFIFLTVILLFTLLCSINLAMLTKQKI
jgi:NADH:ubiquinone oxidoreductase subunit 6 (subunit J)